MDKLILFFLISTNSHFLGNLPREWVGGDGFSESPISEGNVFANPATAESLDYLSIRFRFFSDDYSKLEGKISSISLNLPTSFGFSIGGRYNLLTDSQMETSMDSLNDWDSYTENFWKVGGLNQYSLFLKKSFGNFSLGIDGNLLNGVVEDRWWIDFKNYYDVYDTLSTYFRGYSSGLGIVYHLKNFKMGGYYCIYQKLNFWKEGEEKRDFNLNRPIRLGINYSIDERKSIMLSLNRESALAIGRYRFFQFGYGRIYSSGYGFNTEGRRFIGGVSLFLNKMPLSITVENRRYFGEYKDNEFIGSIKLSISGIEGGKE